MLIPPRTEELLAGVEKTLADVSAALLGGDPNEVLSASTAFKQATLVCADLLQRMTPAELKNPVLGSRLNTIAACLSVRRESLIRRAVLVERALNAVVPATRSSTYSGGGGPYGTAAKSTGSFRYLSA